MGSPRSRCDVWLILLFGLVGCLEETSAERTGDAETRVAVVSTLLFGRRDDGVAWGFDLDGRVSDDRDAEGCYQEDLVDPEGRDGVDSAFSKLVPVLELTEAAAVEGLIQDSIASGELLLLAEVSGIDDPLDDDCVDVRLWRGAGVPMLGTDGAILDYQTFPTDPDQAPGEVLCAQLIDGVVEARPFELALPIQVLDRSLIFTMKDAGLRVDLNDPEAPFGHFGGGVPIAEIIDIVDDDGALAEIRDLVIELVEGNADLDPDSDGQCQQLSIVFEFGATPAYLFE